MATKPTIDPTDRSMQRVMMTIVWASATITRIEMLSRMSWKLPGVRKWGLRTTHHHDQQEDKDADADFAKSRQREDEV